MNSLLAILLTLAPTTGQTSPKDDPAEVTSLPPGQEPAPIVRWSFDETVLGDWTGKPKIEVTDLKAPEFPRLSPANKAAFFSGKGAFLTIPESKLPEPLRFNNGDAITLEAWVNPTALGDKVYAYIIGKGRTGNAGFPAENSMMW